MIVGMYTSDPSGKFFPLQFEASSGQFLFSSMKFQHICEVWLLGGGQIDK